MRIHAALLKLLVICLGLWRKHQKANEYFLIPGFFTLGNQLFGMIRVFNVLTAIIAADMTGYQFS
jgi:hypothetical protein